jgi:AcrR family transcriptional regulator
MAAEIFARKGYEASSMDEIALAVGSSKAAIYHYFDSKLAIYDAIIIETLEGVVQMLLEAVGSAPTSEAKIVAYFQTHLRFQQRNLSETTIIIESVSYAGREVSKREIELRAKTEAIVGDILIAGIKNGSFRKLDVSVTQKALVSIIAWFPKWYPGTHGLDVDRVIAAFMDLVMQGMRVWPDAKSLQVVRTPKQK